MAGAAAAPDGSKTWVATSSRRSHRSIPPAGSSYTDSNYSNTQYQQPEIPDSRILQRPAETLDQFLQQQAAVSELIRLINANANEITSLNRRSLNEVSQTSVAQIRQRIESLNDTTTRLIETARAGVKIMKQSKRGDKSIRQNQYKTSLENLRTAVQLFYNAQKEVRASNRDQIVRQYKIAKPDATDEEVRDAVDSGRTDVFASAIVSGRIQNRQQVLGQVQERQKALEKLAQSMEELVGLMQELRTLIEDQQGMIDLIDEQVEHAVVNVQDANDNLGKAVTSAVNARKNQWRIFWIVLIIVVIIAAIIAIYFALNKKN
ncbi:t-SNARE [Zopfochytrium polystomum]|nr:t-SNARE [Zopfochytrium polystomum]